MHVDPVAETFVTRPIHQAIASVSHAYLLYQIHTCIKDMHARFVKFHFFTLFSCWSQRELDAEFWITNKGVRYLGGGALVVVSLAHSSGVRGPAEGFWSLF
jgi:hypothetical protein